MPANSEQSRLYREQGYLVLKNVLDDAFIGGLRQAILRPLQLLAKNRLGRDISDFDDQALQADLCELKAADTSAYLNALKLSQNDPVILASAAHSGLMDALSLAGLEHPIIALKPFPILIAEELFIEGGYNIRPAHQEWPVMQGSHNGAVIWFPLHDLSEGHSSLEVFPGSHLRGVLEYEPSQCGSKISDPKLGEPVSLSLGKGDLVIFSAFTAHRSAPTAAKLRLAMSLRYNDIAEKTFIERGYPDNTRTTITREPIDDGVHRFEPGMS